MKKFLLLFLITLLGYSVNAEQITITPTAVSYSDDIISMTTAKNTGSQAPAYNTNGKDVRVYAKGSVTIIAAEGVSIDKIVFNISTAELKRLAPITASAGTVATQASGDNTVTWTGSESSVTFTVGDKADYGSDGSTAAGQLCFTSIDIEYTSAVSDTRESVEMSFPKSAYTATLGTAFESPVLTVTPEAARSEVKFATSNENIATVDNSGNVTLIANGDAVITASISDSETYKNAKAEYTLNVIDPNAISVTLDPAFFNYTTKSYGAAAQTDNYGVAYSTVYYYNGGNMQYNTNNSNGKGSGITVTSNSSDYIIKSIDIEMTTVSTSGLGLNVYASDNAFDTLEKNTAPTIPSSATKLNDAIIQASTTININAKAFALIPSTKGVIAVQKVTVYYALDTTLGKEKVEVTFDGGDMTEEFEANKTVQGRIASADVEGLTFSYSSNDTDVATVDNNGMLTLVGAGSTVITATVDDESYTGQASYTLTVTGVYKNFNEIIANAKVNEEIVAKFPMTVGYVNGAYIYTTDNQEGYMLVFMYDNEYAAGDIIPAGMTATYTIYSGLPELKPSTAPATTEKGEYVIETVAASEVMSQPLNKIVKVVDVNFADATPADKQNFTGTVDETSLTFYNQMTLTSVEAGTYDVTLIVSTYTYGATEIQTPNQLQPIEYAAVPSAPKVMIGDTEIDTNTGYELQGHDVVVYLTAQEGATIWYKFTAVNTDQNEAATMSEDGFSEYPSEGITIGQLGTLEYYSELNGRTSEIASLQFKGIPTGINEIEAQTGAGTEWFDLSGRRVAVPSKGGIYIKKTGSEVSKYAF